MAACFFLKTAGTSTSVGYLSNSYLTGTVYGTEISNYLCLSSLDFRGNWDNARSVLTSRGLRFLAARPERGFSRRTPSLASGLKDSSHPLGTLSAAVFAAWPARRSRRRRLEVEACGFCRHTSFRAARTGLSHWRRASVVFFRCHSFPWGQKACSIYANKLMGVAIFASGKCPSSV